MTHEIPDPTTQSWLEQFKSRCDLARIPETIRDSVNDFLEHRAANRAYYLGFPEVDFKLQLESGSDSPKDELIHQIGHSYMRIEGLETGKIPTWQYAQVRPEKHAQFRSMTRSQLIEVLDKSTEHLYQLYTLPETSTKVIQLPWGQSMTGARLFNKMALHEALHLGMNIREADCRDVPRPPEVKNIYG